MELAHSVRKVAQVTDELATDDSLHLGALDLTSNACLWRIGSLGVDSTVAKVASSRHCCEC